MYREIKRYYPDLINAEEKGFSRKDIKEKADSLSTETGK